MNADQRAVLVLLSLAVAGQGVRAVLVPRGEPPGSVSLRGGTTTDTRDQLDSARRAAAPLGAGETVNFDTAAARDLARVPGIGPALAERIVAYRTAHGPFGSPESLDSVPGIGPALLARLAPVATFSPIRRTDPPGRPQGSLPGMRIAMNSASAGQLAALPGIGPAKAQAIVAYREAHGSFATAADLTRVPGIGPATVAKLLPHIDLR